MMPTLDPHGFNFITRFPVPNDARMHRAGRQGMLDQKEDPALSDAQWIACQHEAWANDLIATHLASGGVCWALGAWCRPGQRAGAAAPRALAGDRRTTGL